MISNRKVYDEAYQRALAGRSRGLWERVTALFEDEYSRQSREQGERDGAEARARAEQPAAPEKAEPAATPTAGA